MGVMGGGDEVREGLRGCGDRMGWGVWVAEKGKKMSFFFFFYFFIFYVRINYYNILNV